MITSINNERIKNIRKLHQKKYRKDSYIIEDLKMIDKAKELDLLDMVIVKEGYTYDFNNILEVSAEVMDSISLKGSNIIAIAKIIDRDFELSDKIVLLDDLKDPANIGKIIKSAYIFGFDTILLSKECADLYHEKTIDEAGETFYLLNIKRVDMDEMIFDLKAKGYKIYATGLSHNTKDLFATKAYEKMAIIMGNEGHGVRDDYFKVADEVIKIPMNNIDSLNVAMATAIVMEFYNSK